jgi:hypothetical protein
MHESLYKCESVKVVNIHTQMLAYMIECIMWMHVYVIFH